MRTRRASRTGRRNKFGVADKADRTSRDGRVFDSKAELRRYEQLSLLERAGRIADLTLQPSFPLVLPGGRPVLIRSARYPNGRTATYRADFSYRVVEDMPPARAGETVVEDVKGHDTDVSRLKRAVVEAIHNIHIVVHKS